MAFGVIESTSVGENLALDAWLRGCLSTQSRPSASPAAMPTHAPLRPLPAAVQPAQLDGRDIRTGFLGALRDFSSRPAFPVQNLAHEFFSLSVNYFTHPTVGGCSDMARFDQRRG